MRVPAVVALEHRLGIEGIAGRRSAVHVEEDDVFGLRRMMQLRRDASPWPRATPGSPRRGASARRDGAPSPAAAGGKPFRDATKAERGDSDVAREAGHRSGSSAGNYIIDGRTRTRNGPKPRMSLLRIRGSHAPQPRSMRTMPNSTERFNIPCHTFGNVGLGGTACVRSSPRSPSATCTTSPTAGCSRLRLMALAPAILGVGVALFLYLAVRGLRKDSRRRRVRSWRNRTSSFARWMGRTADCRDSKKCRRRRTRGLEDSSPA